MRLSRIPNYFLGLILLLVAGSAAAEWRDIPYKDVAKMPLALKSADPQGIYTAIYKVVPAEGKASLPADLRFQIKAGQQLVAVSIQPDGRVDFPIRSDWVDADASVQVNQPKGSFRMNFSLIPRTPAGTQMTYGQLTESAPVLERGIKEAAGLMSFLAPKVSAFLIAFPNNTPQTITVTLADGKKKTWKSDAKGSIRLPWEPSWAAATVVLSSPLKGVAPDLK
jgi:hypothetical protein